MQEAGTEGEMDVEIEIAVRFFLILEMLFFSVPFAILRYLPFRDELRISRRHFWILYSIIVLLRASYLFWASWPEMMTLKERHDAYLVSLLAFNLLFFLAIRTFWKQLFVYCIILVYGAGISYLPMYLFGEMSQVTSLGAHLLLCLCVIAEYIVTWRFMYNWLLLECKTFLQYGTKSFWRYFWLLPFTFVLLTVLFGMETNGENTMNGYVVLCSLLANLGLVAAIKGMKRSMECLRDNSILRENIGAVTHLYHVQMERHRVSEGLVRSMRHLRHDMHHFSTEFLRHLEEGDWGSFRESIEKCRQSLIRQDSAGEGKHV